MNQLVVIAAASVLWGSPALVAIAGINTWTSKGPHGGVAQFLAIDPVTPATLYAGVAPLDEPETSSDCHSDGNVTVDELVVMVNIALGNALVRACKAGDGMIPRSPSTSW